MVNDVNKIYDDIEDIMTDLSDEIIIVIKDKVALPDLVKIVKEIKKAKTGIIALLESKNCVT